MKKKSCPTVYVVANAMNEIPTVCYCVCVSWLFNLGLWPDICIYWLFMSFSNEQKKWFGRCYHGLGSNDFMEKKNKKMHRIAIKFLYFNALLPVARAQFLAADLIA